MIRLADTFKTDNFNTHMHKITYQFPSELHVDKLTMYVACVNSATRKMSNVKWCEHFVCLSRTRELLCCFISVGNIPSWVRKEHSPVECLNVSSR